MALQSMTGFASAQGGDDEFDWVWELKSVNGRGLEARFRLPPGFESVEAAGKAAVAKAFGRGNVTLHLSMRRTAETGSVHIDRAVLAKLTTEAETLRDQIGGPPIRAELLLGLRGVLIAEEAVVDPESQGRRVQNILETLDLALGSLKTARRHEGQQLQTVLTALNEELATIVKDITNHPARTPERALEKLHAALDRLKSDPSGFDPDRLHQEAMLLATRSDIEEEVQRLAAHIETAQSLIASEEPVGRRLDFLCQEFNREANTVCSKANDAALSKLGLALKSVIERFREQVQNVE